MATPNVNQLGAAAPKDATGGLLYGPLGTALPTDEASALNGALKGLGFFSDEGLRPSGDAPSTDDRFAWGGTNVANITTQRGTRKFQITLWSFFDTDVNTLIYGSANVTPTAATSTSGKKLAILDKQIVIPPQVFVSEMFARDGSAAVRFGIPNGKLVVTNELPYTHTELMGYECEITCLPDASGVSIYRYLNDGNKTA